MLFQLKLLRASNWLRHLNCKKYLPFTFNCISILNRNYKWSKSEALSRLSTKCVNGTNKRGTLPQAFYSFCQQFPIVLASLFIILFDSVSSLLLPNYLFDVYLLSYVLSVFIVFVVASVPINLNPPILQFYREPVRSSTCITIHKNTILLN